MFTYSIHCDYKCMKLTCAASAAAFISSLVAQGTRDIISLVAYRNKQTINITNISVFDKIM